MNQKEYIQFQVHEKNKLIVFGSIAMIIFICSSFGIMICGALNGL